MEARKFTGKSKRSKGSIDRSCRSKGNSSLPLLRSAEEKDKETVAEPTGKQKKKKPSPARAVVHTGVASNRRRGVRPWLESSGDQSGVVDVVELAGDDARKRETEIER
ncbi:hypothetical protein JCGZ_16220 [Jatropha curcas]|uniref:Uncharacterized protein n=1 Tax=Jatropha curcas TaxID=180498 RepID=A0A067KFR0_JATCU|nr:hypothetical protein JCGZ_16220 [Jatropha curcas]